MTCPGLSNARLSKGWGHLKDLRMDETKVLSFEAVYRGLDEVKLEQLDSQRATLVQEAVVALDRVIANRGLRFEPRDVVAAEQELKGIAGWLVFPAIGLVLSPITSVAVSVMNLKMIQVSAPDLFRDSRLWFIILIEVVATVMTIAVAVLFFKKRRIAVHACIGLLAVWVVAALAQTLLSIAMFKKSDADAIKLVIRSCVGAAFWAAFWIPYFLKSKRVKNTFIE